jgi:hypothetical protein
MPKTAKSTAVPLTPKPRDLIKIVRRLAAEGRISYTRHAEQERMPERGIDFVDVESVFRLGDISGSIEPGSKIGEWKCVVVGKPKSNAREMGVVTIVVQQSRLIVKTVEWMDR